MWEILAGTLLIGAAAWFAIARLWTPPPYRRTQVPKKQHRDKGRAQRSERTPKAGAFVPLFVLAFLWPYTEEFLEGASEIAQVEVEKYLPAVDGILTALIIIIAVASKAKVRWWWAIIGLAVTVGLGIWSVLTREAPSLPRDLFFSICYTFAFTAVIMAVLEVRFAPGRRKRAKLAPLDATEEVAEAKVTWRRFRVALPLLFGMFAAFFASTMWEHLIEPLNCVANCQAQDSSKKIWDHVGVHQEYFAQASQIIPLLLIAVGVEARFFDQLRRGAMERTLILITVITLCVGEMLAISAITSETLHPWHEYTAFVVTAQACSIALVTLLWARARSGRAPTGVMASDEAGTDESAVRP
jgi:hypothetical protein